MLGQQQVGRNLNPCLRKQGYCLSRVQAGVKTQNTAVDWQHEQEFDHYICDQVLYNQYFISLEGYLNKYYVI